MKQTSPAGVDMTQTEHTSLAAGVDVPLTLMKQTSQAGVDMTWTEHTSPADVAML